MTFSHIEYYSYETIPALVTDFHRAADDGAVIISGSQAHQPQAMEFYKNSFLHYGLGNLFSISITKVSPPARLSSTAMYSMMTNTSTPNFSPSCLSTMPSPAS